MLKLMNILIQISVAENMHYFVSHVSDFEDKSRLNSDTHIFTNTLFKVNKVYLLTPIEMRLKIVFTSQFYLSQHLFAHNSILTKI